MGEDVKNRVLVEGRYIAETGSTVRQAAKVFHFSKSTVHKDVTERLYVLDRKLHFAVKKVLEKNLSERHIRGGQATKLKYLAEKNSVLS
jgi:putative DeoR family transcriptional regulator (stage III sporulation protein D)